MFDFDKAKKAFERYVDNYDRDNYMVRLKIIHTYGVVKISELIAKNLGLDEENIFLAKLIALLHDIGRFEQAKKFSSFEDYKTLDHGDLGIKILFGGDKFIRKFIASDKYDEIIKVSIMNHNKFQIDNDLTDTFLLHAKLIRDADKIDNFRVKSTESFSNMFARDQQDLKHSCITDIIYNQFMDNKLILSNLRKSSIDYWVSYIAFIFDLNYRYSFIYIKENDYVNKMVNRLNLLVPDTKMKMENIRLYALKYIDNQLKEIV